MKAGWKFLCTLITVYVIVANTLSAQEAVERAILDIGPSKERGLLFLPINVIDHYTGEYIVGDSRFTVYYTEASIVLFDTWTKLNCTSRRLRVVESVDESVLMYVVDDEEWHVFVEAPQNNEVICKFVDVFIRRLRYFKEAAETGVPPFPAILDLR